MHELTKVFLAAAAGGLIAQYVEPKILAMFPSAVAAGSWEATGVHVATIGAGAVAVGYLLRK